MSLRRALFVSLLLTACGGRTDAQQGQTDAGAGGQPVGAGGASAGGSTSRGGAGGSKTTQGGGGVAGTAPNAGYGGDIAAPCDGPVLLCEGCAGGPPIAPICTGSGWQCPAVDCPLPPLCATREDCGANSFCSGGIGVCPSAAMRGVCTLEPTNCTAEYSPHCGCVSGQVYGNECAANMAGEPAFPCNGTVGAGGTVGGGGSPGKGGASAGTGGASTGTGGGPATCGGIAGATCGDGFYCAFDNKLCGGDDGLGKCAPVECGPPDDLGDVCGCDGKVSPSLCQAHLAGIDVTVQSARCPTPQAEFACGTHFCRMYSSYCQIDQSDVFGEADFYSCPSLPVECQDGTGGCGCLTQQPCGFSCNGTPADGLTLLCPGG